MNYHEYQEYRLKYYSEENQRLFFQLDYLLNYLKINNNYSQDISSKWEEIKQKFDENGHITFKDITDFENDLSHVSKEIKKQSVLCIAHAHMDINWMWGYDETVSLVVSTIETMISLLEKYSTFTYGQSQMLVFEILEKYRPDLLEKLVKYIKEGRVEISSCTYVEGDKNLSSAQTQLLQIKTTKKYFEKLLGKVDLEIDFEPDTFGHSLYVPEILTSEGVKYYYHCRGNLLPPIYRWKAPNGKNSILVYREPMWYNSTIEHTSFLHVPDFCARYGVSKLLKVYGVGDHGGGASIRDIERIIAFSKLPLFPDIRFGTYKEFFKHLETLKNIPEITGEQNQIFTGCYSSNSDIKHYNNILQNAIYDTRMYQSIYSGTYDFEDAEKIVLLNEFHDILPGSGVKESYSYALGKYQEASAGLGTSKDKTLKSFANKINTLPLFSEKIDDINDTSYGSGVGFSNNNLSFSNHIAYGKERAFVIFNQLNINRQEIISIPLWDYYYEVNNLEVSDGTKSLEFSLKSKESSFYWSHNYHELNVLIDIPALGYKTIIIKPKQQTLEDTSYPPLFQRIEDPYEDVVLENEYIRAVFNANTFELIALIDNKQNKINTSIKGTFNFILEDADLEMTSWYKGRTKHVQSVNDSVKLLSRHIEVNGLRSSFQYQTTFNNSKMIVTVKLDKDSKKIDYELDIDFFEKGNSECGVPTLVYTLKTNEQFEDVWGDVPLGLICRKTSKLDRPYKTFVKTPSYALFTAGKHGVKVDDDVMELTLLRGTYDPHPYPDYGHHQIRFSISPIKDISKAYQIAKAFNHPLSVISTTPHKGELKTYGKLWTIDGNVDIIDVIKEDNTLSMSLFNYQEKKQDVSLSFDFMPVGFSSSSNSNIASKGNTLSLSIEGLSLVNLKIKF